MTGTCHSTCRQDALEEAYSYLHEYNQPVFAKLEHEPDNPFDNNAIAVFVQTDAEYKKVGYIASELTKYVLPHLRESEFDVSVKHIRYKFLESWVLYYPRTFKARTLEQGGY